MQQTAVARKAGDGTARHVSHSLVLEIALDDPLARSSRGARVPPRPSSETGQGDPLIGWLRLIV